jgi:probable DNA metabolism protein
VTFEYDGSFAGFLCVARGLHENPCPGATFLKAERMRDGLFAAEAIAIETNRAEAEAFYREIARHIRAQALWALHEAFCSDHPGIETALVDYIAVAFDIGMAIRQRLDIPCVLAVEKAAKRAGAEAHLLKGLLRFSELRDKSLYAVIEPDCDVLPLLASHFERRLPAFFWVIRDRRRDTALVHEPGRKAVAVTGLRFEAADIPALTDPAATVAEKPAATIEPSGALLSEEETFIRRAWAGYVKTIAIKERLNPKVQRGHMPKKYWKYLPEIEEQA